MHGAADPTANFQRGRGSFGGAGGQDLPCPGRRRSRIENRRQPAAAPAAPTRCGTPRFRPTRSVPGNGSRLGWWRAVWPPAARVTGPEVPRAPFAQHVRDTRPSADFSRLWDHAAQRRSSGARSRADFGADRARDVAKRRWQSPEPKAEGEFAGLRGLGCRHKGPTERRRELAPMRPDHPHDPASVPSSKTLR